MIELEAYYVGVLTTRLSVPFRGVFVLGEITHVTGARGRLAEIIDAQASAFRSKNDVTIDTVLRVEALLGKNGLAMPARPKTFDEYLRWAHDCGKVAADSLAADSPSLAALLVGQALGALVANVTLASLFRTLHELVPDLEVLGRSLFGEQIADFARAAVDAATRLENVAHARALAAATRPILERALATARSVDLARASSADLGPVSRALTHASEEVFAALEPVVPILLLRVARAKAEVSGVLFAGDVAVVERDCASIGVALDRLCAAATGRGISLHKSTIVYPLDGRHAIASVALDESQKRGFEFSRHLPPGKAHWLIDLDGSDAAPSLSPEKVGALMDELGNQANTAVDDAELAESMAIQRQMLTVCVRHFGWWFPYTFVLLSRWVAVAAKTGADQNVREACELAQHAVAQPRPAALTNVGPMLMRLDELGQYCMRSGHAAAGNAVLAAAASLRP